MNIIIIPSWYESKRRPTLGSFFKEQAIALAKNGHKVTLVFPGLVGSMEVFDCNIKLKSYKENGITVYRVDTPGFGINRFEKIDEKLFSLKLKYIINKVIKKEGKPDIVHAHSCIWAGYSAVKIFGNLGIPVVITEHSTAFPKNEIKGYKERCVRTCINEASGIITVSNGLKESLGKYNDNNKEIKVIPNMFNEELFNSEHIKRTESKFRFVSVCYLSHKKGIDILLEAFCKSFKGNNSVELLIGGQGEKYNDLVNLSINLGIEKQVSFLGDLKREDVANLIANSDVFALPSRFETFGVVFIEALALGKPIIASKCGGPEDIVNDKNGLLVEVENIEDLSNAMIQIYKNYKNYDKDKIIEDCKARFSETSIVNQLEQYYGHIIRKSKIIE